jgi:replicative DNA helicase
MTAHLDDYRGNGHASGDAYIPSPPYNIDVEVALLGMLMHDSRQLDEVLLILDADDFFRDAHQVILRQIRVRHDKGLPVDFRLVMEDMEAANELRSVGGDAAFEEMSAEGVVSENAVHYAQVVKQLAIARKLSEAGEETRREGCSRQYTAAELLARAQERIFAIAEAQSGDDTAGGGVVADEAWDVLMRRAEGEFEGVGTGLVGLDRIVNCLPNGGVSILAGRPGSGKTSLAMNICEHNAFDSGIATLFVSLEMRRQDLGIRLLASQARVSGKLLKRAYLLDRPEHREEMDRLVIARQRIRDSRLLINHAPGLTVSQIAACARLEKARHGIGLLVIDYLSLIAMGGRKQDSRQEEVARTSVAIRDLARRLDIPVLLICQLNRAVENREDKRPRMADLRESGQLEQDADLILLVHRPEYYDPDDRPGEADVYVSKNRNGETGPVRMAFFKDLTRFEDLAHAGERRDEWNPED